GEGRIDSQTIHGKVPIGVANIAKRYNKQVIGIAGSLTADVGVMSTLVRGLHPVKKRYCERKFWTTECVAVPECAAMELFYLYSV
ncbi:glycerate kinase, partial [Salmonella enterica subsp. enterica serovar Agona]|nr:glycerate kinase [Salmonella enterica subsp. enterica serovar Agona]